MTGFDEIWQHYYPRLRMFAASFSGLSASDREDCIQEIFLAVYRNLERYDERWSLSTWIYRIARNKLIDYQRRASRHPVTVMDDDVPDSRGDDMSRAESSLDLARAIGKLDESQRAAVYLYYSEDLPVAEIASILGKPEGSIKSLLHRSRKALKIELEEAYAPGR